MKIQKPGYGEGILPKGKTGAAKSTTGTDFATLLKSQMQGVEQPPATPAVKASSGVTDTVATGLRLQGLALSETTINNLDSFGNALSQSHIPSQALEPYIEALEEETSALLTLKDKLPTDDPLAKLLERVATVTYLETAKFRRGDYQP